MSLWKLAKSGKFTDITINEISLDGTIVPHYVHKVMLYDQCPYFATLFDSGMSDADLQNINIHTQSNYSGILGDIFHAIYEKPKKIYTTLCLDPEISKEYIFDIYHLLQYLCMETHLARISQVIIKNMSKKDVISFWVELNLKELPIHQILYKFIYDNCVITRAALGGQYIRISDLLELWPVDASPDYFAKLRELIQKSLS